MKFKIPKLLIYVSAAVIAVLMLANGLLLKESSRDLVWPVTTGVCIVFTAVAYAYVRIVKEMQSRLEVLYRREEAHRNILSAVQPRFPLPPMTGWAIFSDAGILILEQILITKPKLILECGSGISTLLSAYALEKTGGGRILSIDHDEAFAGVTRTHLIRHGFAPTLHTVTYAPLIQQSALGKTFIWYDPAFLASLKEKIDLLIVDGPPHKTQFQARLPALPLLISKLSDTATVILDDAKREDETGIVQSWLSQFPDFSLALHDTQKGVAILKRNKV